MDFEARILRAMSHEQLARRRWGFPNVVAVLGAVLLLAGSGCGAPASPHEVHSSGEALGTTWSVKWVSRAAAEPIRSDELRGRVAAVLERVDRGMSNWREDAELARFNRQSSRPRSSSPPRPAG